MQRRCVLHRLRGRHNVHAPHARGGDLRVVAPAMQVMIRGSVPGVVEASRVHEFVLATFYNKGLDVEGVWRSGFRRGEGGLRTLGPPHT